MSSTPYPSERIEVVCGIITDEFDRILICQRNAGKHAGGLWEFPGGKVEPGESEADALRRELLEELNIKVEVGRRFTSVLWKYDALVVHLHPFHCRIRDGIPFLTEHQSLAWCQPSQLDSYDWVPADRPVMQEIFELHTRRKTSIDFPSENHKSPIS